MVLINDKNHNDRPLYEVKKKGRPATQCVHCRQARKDRALHVKCDCAVPSSGEPARTPVEKARPAITPAIAPVFPNGFRDVHAMNDAAEALHSLTRGQGGGDTVEAKVRKVDALLNPCRCLSGGKCNCCRPRPREASSGTSTPSDVATPHIQTSTDKLADMFSTVSTTSSETSRVPPASAYINRYPLHDSSIRISDTHHPAHTSPYVHKAKLYSPYSPNTRHSSMEANGSSQKHHRPPARVHASSSSSNPHDSSNTLPSIRSLSTDAAARNDQIKDLVLPSIIEFPTAMEITLDGCTCGENCACPGCAVHPQTSLEAENVEAGKAAHAKEPGTCPTSCTSCFDCRARVSVPAGIPTIDQLITVASSAIPLPPSTLGRPSSAHNGPAKAFELDGLHTSVLPKVALQNEQAAEAWGLNKLKPLECCNGRCQCSPGNCNCDSECCGCCSFCSCGEPESLAAVEPMQVDGASFQTPSLKDILGPLDAPAVRGGCCAAETEVEVSRRPSASVTEAAAATSASRPELVARHSSLSDAGGRMTPGSDITQSSPAAVPPVQPKSCCAQDKADQAPPDSLPAPAPATAKPRVLSRSASTSRPHSTSHTPKAILPRPAGPSTANPINTVSTIQTKNGAKHQLVLPPSSRTIQIEKSLHRRASGRKPSKSGAATPSGQPVSGEVSPGSYAADTSAVAPVDNPFNNHAFDSLLPVPAAFDFASGEATPIEGLDDGIWDLIDDGERWILPSAPPPDDLLAEFDIPGDDRGEH
ncbi:hypothetical protein NliqN6_2363 [Naganishia liquefaciens]|uniref:Copper-fist domain-containing protein n=1 Tax=Naganishia liquefaciens TaxID=104408 RepID=A0A8H3YFQ7_9TREE|nr:hypothetical protein NliqN6_2363 [Naganishia liquefaciens]